MEQGKHPAHSGLANHLMAVLQELRREVHVEFGRALCERAHCSALGHPGYRAVVWVPPDVGEAGGDKGVLCAAP